MEGITFAVSSFVPQPVKPTAVRADNESDVASLFSVIVISFLFVTLAYNRVLRLWFLFDYSGFQMIEEAGVHFVLPPNHKSVVLTGGSLKNRLVASPVQF